MGKIGTRLMTIPAGWGEDERLLMTRYNNDSRLHSQRAFFEKKEVVSIDRLQNIY